MSQLLIGNHLQERIVAQTVGIVSVFVSGDDLVDALPRQGQRIVAHTLRWRSRSAEYYLRWATVVLHCSSGNKDYNQGVRHYTTKRIKDGTMFICAHCEHRVTTQDFHREAGNLRTQAATAINLHSAAVHGQPMAVSSTDSQQRIWRN